MPSATPTLQSRLGRYSVVQVDTPEHGLVNLGILLQDPGTDSLRLRFRRDLESLVEEEDLEVLAAFATDLDQKAQEWGAEKLFEYLESNLSNAIRITDREELLVDDFDRAVDRLYRKNVQSNVLEFRTHLPKYSLRAAAGKFLENAEISEDGWVETPQDLRLTPDMFVAEIAGHSMEPRIPDGSLCVFRYGVVGSRTGRLVLAEQLDTAGNDRYAVKRYRSDTTKGPKTIRLESLNPEYPSWDLDPDPDSDGAKYRILAEFVRVLD
ncbi:MAG TPA: S24 family peptidase [Bryobacteraceae bacterium]|jgi:phage repressor protein C with HTH and peptisase S24 domain|nr:S24 family peptidase [Bryobacteraceae bacterium]